MDVTVSSLPAVLRELGPRFAERVPEADATDSFVAENYRELKERRVFSALVPPDYGGRGESFSAMVAFLRGMAPFCSSTALALAMHQHLIAAAVWNDRNGKPGRKLLEMVGAAEAVLVSTGANDWMSSSGSTEAADGGFRVTARKPFGSGSPAGDVVVTSAPWDDPEEGPQVIHFAVPLSAEGVSFAGDWQAHGMRGTGSQTVILDGVFVPAESVVLRRPRGAYHPVWNTVVTVAMTLISAVYVGIADAARDEARATAAKRKAEDLLCLQVGEMTGRHAIADMALRDMVAMVNDFGFENDVELASEILARKSIAIEASQAVVRSALEIAGGGGYLRRGRIERLLRDVTAGQFHPLPEKRQQIFSGRVALGLDPVSGAA
jgi:alkylation response protein AidB-like acyl-CoA dehydrogenase